MLNFEVTPEQYAKANEWLNEIARPFLIDKQRKGTRNPGRDVSECYWDAGVPYNETIEYRFSDSGGIGRSVRMIVTAGAFEIDFDLTDYDKW